MNSGMKSRGITRLATLLAIAGCLNGCDVKGDGTVQSTFFVMKLQCTNYQVTDDCNVSPLERLDVTLSLSGQKVSWKKTLFEVSASDYVPGRSCVVISDDDFNCEQLSLHDGKLLPADYSDWWPEFFGLQIRADDHAISRLLWMLSSAKNPQSLRLGTFNVLSNTSIVVVVAFAAACGIIKLWFELIAWLDRRDERRRDEQRKRMGYDR